MDSIYVVEAENLLRGFINTRDDYYAAKVLDDILDCTNGVVRLRELVLKMSKYCKCLILMPTRGILKITKYVLRDYDCVIVVDSVVDFLYSNSEIINHIKNIDSVILITDLDSDFKCLKMFCNYVKPIVVVHAHGDNVDKLHNIEDLEFCNICGTCQVVHTFRYVEYCPGFTDGDRAIHIAYMSGCVVDIPELDYSQTLSSKGISDVKKVKLEIFRRNVERLKISDLRLFIL